MVTMDEARAYLRVDSGFEDSLIGSLLLSAEALCMDVARLSKAEWDAISAYTEDSEETITVRQEEKSVGEALQMKEILRIGVLYALGYLFEHREKADHHALVMYHTSLIQ